MHCARRSLILVLTLFFTPIFAQQPGSIMGSEQKPIYSSSPGISGNSVRSEHCKKLYKKIDALKGKPQRRYTAAQRYKDECTDQNRR